MSRAGLGGGGGVGAGHSFKEEIEIMATNEYADFCQKGFSHPVGGFIGLITY